MPATRRARTSGGPATKGAQSTLSFGGRSRITKAVPAASKLSKDNTESIKAEAVTIEPAAEETEVGHILPEVAVQEEAEIELIKSKSEAESRAEKVSDAQIKKYWKAREGERTTKRVHQEGLSTEEKILRLFDISSQYGPCIGIARMKRWIRANKLGLRPPIEVLAILLKEEGEGNTRIERAHVDELMSAKSVVGDS